MRKNIDDYAPFLEENIDIHAYIDDVEHSSSIFFTVCKYLLEWGGQLEIKAISEGYKVPIMVYSANQSPLLMGEQFTVFFMLFFDS